MEEAVRLLGVDESGDWRWHEKPLMTGMARSSSGPSCKSYAPPTPRRFHRVARREKKLLTPRFARPRGRSHYTVAVHSTHTTSALTRSPHLKGLASSRQPRGATRGQEGDARVGPPPHTLATHRARTRHGSIAGSPVLLPQYIHSVHLSHGTLAGSPPPVHPLSTIIEAAAPVEGGRVGNQWAATVPPPSDRGAPATPGGGRRIERCWAIGLVDRGDARGRLPAAQHVIVEGLVQGAHHILRVRS